MNDLKLRRSKYTPVQAIERPAYPPLVPATQQLLFRFPNGYGVSLIRGGISYGVEAAPMIWTGDGEDGWDLLYDDNPEAQRLPDYPAGPGIWPWLAPENIEAVLDTVASWPTREAAVERASAEREIER